MIACLKSHSKGGRAPLHAVSQYFLEDQIIWESNGTVDRVQRDERFLPHSWPLLTRERASESFKSYLERYETIEAQRPVGRMVKMVVQCGRRERRGEAYSCTLSL
jgi:hypothetical protein